MAGPEDGNAQPNAEGGGEPVQYAARDLEAELQAEKDFENGDYTELTAEELDRYIAGEIPWPDESPL